MTEATRLLLEALGGTPDREGLANTWQCRVPAVFATLTDQNREAAKPTMRTFDADSEDLVIKTRFPFYSRCEHPLIHFHSTVHIAYRPGNEIVRLSKLARYAAGSHANSRCKSAS